MVCSLLRPCKLYPQCKTYQPKQQLNFLAWLMPQNTAFFSTIICWAMVNVNWFCWYPLAISVWYDHFSPKWSKVRKKFLWAHLVVSEPMHFFVMLLPICLVKCFHTAVFQNLIFGLKKGIKERKTHITYSWWGRESKTCDKYYNFMMSF